MDPLFIFFGFFFCLGYAGTFCGLVQTQKKLIQMFCGVSPVLNFDVMKYGKRVLLLHVLLSRVAYRARTPSPELRFFSSKHTEAIAFGLSPQSSFILLSSACVEKLSTSECETIFAHELGHLILRHRCKSFLVYSCLGGFRLSFFSCMFLLFLMLIESIPASYLSQLVIVALICIVCKACTFLIWRYMARKSEFQADMFAAKLLFSRDGLISLLLKIENEEAIRISQNTVIGKLLQTHPPIKERIKNIQTMTF